MRRFIGSLARNSPIVSIDSIGAFSGTCLRDYCSMESAADADFLLTISFLEAWEARHGWVPPRSWVLLRTDRYKRPPRTYVNLLNDGPHPHPPGEKGADVHGFGTETIGTDAGQAAYFKPPYPAHNYMHGRGRYGLQRLANLGCRQPAP
jgi:kynurenine formamidase